ncbi:hypothetical protein BC831DRAFT_469896 [Entophlyctis helioformis]|nr:hypothetical protein BC831DRAFT_469896 [Entophlyctis helioformis]
MSTSRLSTASTSTTATATTAPVAANTSSSSAANGTDPYGGFDPSMFDPSMFIPCFDPVLTLQLMQNETITAAALNVFVLYIVSRSATGNASARLPLLGSLLWLVNCTSMIFFAHLTSEPSGAASALLIISFVADLASRLAVTAYLYSRVSTVSPYPWLDMVLAAANAVTNIVVFVLMVVDQTNQRNPSSSLYKIYVGIDLIHTVTVVYLAYLAHLLYSDLVKTHHNKRVPLKFFEFVKGLMYLFIFVALSISTVVISTKNKDFQGSYYLVMSSYRFLFLEMFNSSNLNAIFDKQNGPRSLSADLFTNDANRLASEPATPAASQLPQSPAKSHIQ